MGSHEVKHSTIKTVGVSENLSTEFQMHVHMKFLLSPCTHVDLDGKYLIPCTCVGQYLALFGHGMEFSLPKH